MRGYAIKFPNVSKNAILNVKNRIGKQIALKSNLDLKAQVWMSLTRKFWDMLLHIHNVVLGILMKFMDAQNSTHGTF